MAAYFGQHRVRGCWRPVELWSVLIAIIGTSSHTENIGPHVAPKPQAVSVGDLSIELLDTVPSRRYWQCPNFSRREVAMRPLEALAIYVAPLLVGGALARFPFRSDGSSKAGWIWASDTQAVPHLRPVPPSLTRRLVHRSRRSEFPGHRHGGRKAPVSEPCYDLLACGGRRSRRRLLNPRTSISPPAEAHRAGFFARSQAFAPLSWNRRFRNA